MRTLTKNEIHSKIDIDNLSPQSLHMIMFVESRGYEFLSDFSGNIFYKIQHEGCTSTSPVGIKIPELKAVHNEMKKDGE